jgi:hypothetical protein
MSNHWDHHDHDPTSFASVALEQRPTISLRHMSMSSGAFTDNATGDKFRSVDDANIALLELAVNSGHAFGGIMIESDPTSDVKRALHVVIHWGLTSHRYHLDTITYALPGEARP